MADSFVDEYREFRRTEDYRLLREAWRQQRRLPRENPDDRADKWVVQGEDGTRIAYLAEEDGSNREARIDCNGCPSVKKLAFEVNQIVQKIAGEHSSEYPSLLGEVGKLEGMFYVYMAEENNPFGEVGCTRREMKYLFDPRRSDFNKDLAVVVWDETIDMNKIGSIQMRMRGKRVYYFKSGEKGKEKVIKVSVVGKDKVKITYYRMFREKSEMPIPLTEAEIRMKQEVMKAYEAEKKQEAAEKAKNPDKRRKNVWGYDEYIQKKLTEDTTVEGNYGLSIEHKHNLPRRLHVLDIRTKTRFGDEYQLTTRTEINDRRQEVNIGFGDKDKNYIELEADSSEVSVKLPYTMQVQSTDLKVQGAVVAGTESKGINLSLLSVSGERYADLEYKVDDERTFFNAKHEKRVGPGSVIIGIQKSSYSNGLGDDETRVYAGYQMSF